ncbi:hypothetical protein [Cyclobacterium jeungdonense]|uniref:Uncharacterized protein n=1 Tax=Cyclobacterium jeungdonense TaxID=708087 RepID=A0ABT8CE10_9BACT|nr:hypothetical protein [Cyclobacterium jeungdonense]MDN3689955.1 hypothetical protein [Cyclobacterium jeungdonense]
MLAADYKTLFSVDILHDFHLNNGEERFETMADADKERTLDNYRWESFLKINPTIETRRKFERFQFLLKNSPSKLRILVRVSEDAPQESFIPIEQELTLAFTVEYKDPHFENYTDMPFLVGNKMLFSNFQPEEPENMSFHPISLENDAEYFSEDWLITDENFHLLLEKYARLDPGISPVGLILIRMQGESGMRNVININQSIKINPTVFKIHFNNRSTYWRFLHASSGTEIETNQPKPLTKNGFVELDPEADFDVDAGSISQFRFPNPGSKRISSDGNNYYSEITI